MRLSRIVAERKTLHVEVGEHALHVVYRPQAVTPAMLDRMTVANEKPGSMLVSVVCDLVEGWDLTDDQGEGYPLVAESVRLLPRAFLSTVVKTVTEDINPNPTKRRALSATSSLAG